MERASSRQAGGLPRSLRRKPPALAGGVFTGVPSIAVPSPRAPGARSARTVDGVAAGVARPCPEERSLDLLPKIPDLVHEAIIVAEVGARPGAAPRIAYANGAL